MLLPQLPGLMPAPQPIPGPVPRAAASRGCVAALAQNYAGELPPYMREVYGKKVGTRLLYRSDMEA